MRNCNRLLVTFLYNIFLQDAVVINQPLAPPSKVDAGHTRAKEHFILTVVMMLLCFLHGNLLAFICLIPAFLFSRMVNDFAWLYWTICETIIIQSVLLTQIVDINVALMKLLWNITHLNQKSHYTILSVGCIPILGTFDINFIRHYTVYKKHKLCTEKGYTEQSTSSKPYNLVYCWMANLEN